MQVMTESQPALSFLFSAISRLAGSEPLVVLVPLMGPVGKGAWVGKTALGWKAWSIDCVRDKLKVKMNRN